MKFKQLAHRFVDDDTGILACGKSSSLYEYFDGWEGVTCPACLVLKGPGGEVLNMLDRPVSGVKNPGITPTDQYLINKAEDLENEAERILAIAKSMRVRAAELQKMRENGR